MSSVFVDSGTLKEILMAGLFKQEPTIMLGTITCTQGVTEAEILDMNEKRLGLAWRSDLNALISEAEELGHSRKNPNLALIHRAISDMEELAAYDKKLTEQDKKRALRTADVIPFKPR